MSSHKSVLLITENRSSGFSKKVIEAAYTSKQKLIIESPAYKILSKVLDGEVGVVILDHDELGTTADHIFRSIRMFHSSTPVLMAFSKKIILEQLMTRVHDRDISLDQLAKIMGDAMELDEEIRSELNLSYVFEKDITLKRMAEILTKSLEFDEALDLAKKEFERQFEEKGIAKLTGPDLTKAIDEIRKQAYSSPVFTHLRAQMEKGDKELKEENRRSLH